MDELIKRLREVADEVDNDYDVDPYNAEQRCLAILQAADAIEELTRRCEQLQYMPPPAWIPVTEQLPKPNECDARGYAVPYLVMNGWTRVTARRTENYWVLFGAGTVLDHVTHWMPLPAPPKEEA